MRNLLLMILVLSGTADTLCQEISPSSDLKKRNNIIVLLDLSDRVLTPGQIEKDQKTIGLIIDHFWEKVKLLPLAKYDALKVVVAPQDDITYDLEDIGKRMTVDLTLLTIQDKKPSRLKNMLYDDLSKAVSTVYNRCKMSHQAKDYKGAQLWRYLKDFYKSEVYCESGYQCKNYLLVLTDGYLDFEGYSAQRSESNKTTSTRFIQSHLLDLDSGWEEYYNKKSYGILDVGYEVPNLKVMVIGIQPKDHKYQYDILTRVWTDWMTKFGSQDTRLFLADQMNSLEREIKRFLE